jgi:hypothetical protein
MDREELLLDMMNAGNVAIHNFSRGYPFCFLSCWHEEIFKAEAMLNIIETSKRN